MTPELRAALALLRIAAQGVVIASDDPYTRNLARALDHVANTLLPETDDKEGTRNE